jgi:hypothetical protein
MKKIKILAVMALLMTFGCSNEDLINTEQNSEVLEGNLSLINGERKNNPNNGVSSIVFYSNSIVNTNFVSDCLPEGLDLLKQGNFSGNLSGFGKLNANLSRYQFISCEEWPIDSPPNYGEPLMYKIVTQGKLALGSKDYCDITITGNIYPWYYTEYGFYGGVFIGTAITKSGVGKLKGLNNKSFEVYSGSPKGPTINLDEGTIALRISDAGQ